MTIRPEVAQDRDAIYAVVSAAFGQPAEANLVDGLRQAGELVISLVEVEANAVIGHVAASPIRLDPDAGLVFYIARRSASAIVEEVI